MYWRGGGTEPARQVWNVQSGTVPMKTLRIRVWVRVRATARIRVRVTITVRVTVRFYHEPVLTPFLDGK